MKRLSLARLPILITAGALGGLLALAATLGAPSVLAGTRSASQPVTIPDCGACNVIVVAKKGGNFDDPIAAMSHIFSRTPSKTNRFLLQIGPGTYELSAPLQMLEYVDIQGAGQAITILARGGSDTHPVTDSSSATVSGAGNAEMRFLAVQNTGGFNYATGIRSSGASPKLSHITVSASGGFFNNVGVYNHNSSSPVMTNVTTTGSGGSNSFGVWNHNSSSPIMTNVAAAGSDSFNGGYGVRNFSSSPIMTNVTATGSGSLNGGYGVYNSSGSSPIMTNVIASGSGGRSSYGVYNSFSSPEMTGVTATGSGGVNSYGVQNFRSSPIMTDITASGSAGTGSNYGVHNYGVHNNSSSAGIRGSRLAGSGGISSYGIYNTGGAATVIVDASQIIGGTAAIFNQTEYMVKAGGSLVDGGAVGGGGTIVCAQSYNGDYDFLMPDCNTTYDPSP